jgi:two-component system, cell cycle sensor histidine kinase and response regulator CckA
MSVHLALSLLFLSAFAALLLGVGMGVTRDLPPFLQACLYGAAALWAGAVVYFLNRAVRSRRGADEAYRFLCEGASDAIAVMNSKLDILEVNAAVCELLGYSRAELLKMNLHDLVPPEESAARPLKFESVLYKGETVVQQRNLRGKDGALRTAEVSVRALGDGRLIVIGRDVSARSRAAEFVSESEALTRSVVYTAVDGIVTIDEQGIVQSFNPAAERLFGYSAEQVVGRNVSMLMPSPDRERHEEYVGRYLETGEKKIIGIGRETVGLRSDGTEFPIELAVSETMLPGRRLFTGIVHDITQRKLAEAVLEETNAKLQAVIETSPVAVVLLDFEGKVLNWNPAAERIFGWTAAEAIGCFLPAIPEDARDEFLQSLALACEGQPAVGIERRRLRKDGSLVDVAVWNAPLRNSAGDAVAVLGVSVDITQRKQLEEQFRRAQKMEAIGRLAGGVAHDFNNILTVITGYGQMVLESVGDNAELRSQLEEVLRAADHASVLTSQLLVFSRHQVSRHEPVDLGDLVQRLEKMLRRLIGEDIRLETTAEPDLGLVRADVAQIEQIIMNLAVNARDAMPKGGLLSIELQNVELDSWYSETHVGVEEGPYVMLAVSDTGTGIPPEVRARLFEPFFTTKERGKGTGLGLSTVYGIVKQSGGHVWVYSENNKGTVFKIYLPRVWETKPAAEVKPDASVPTGGAETVLLAEDEVGLRALVRNILRQHGYRVLEASDVEDALRLCSDYAGRIDLLLTDVVMPIMSGRELAERAAEIRPELKVLYMSGYTDNIVVHHGVSASETQFLQKPFTPRGLAQKVRAILDRPAA